MDDRRTSDRLPLPVERQGLMVYGQRKHLYGQALDESAGGVGVQLKSEVRFQVGEHVLIHRLHDRQLRLATVRHARYNGQSGTRLGLQWC